MTYYGRCRFCGQDVTSQDPRVAVRGVTGWEPIRSQGGANHIIARKVVPEMIAHELCAKEDDRIGGDQESLL